MKKYLVLSVLLAGCTAQQSAVKNDTVQPTSSNGKDFVTSLIILDCSYKNQGCVHFDSFAACTYQLNNAVASMSKVQIAMLEDLLRTQYGFDNKDDAEINDTADMILARYMQCGKK